MLVSPIHLGWCGRTLVQLTCQNLVARFNHQVFEAGQSSDQPISLEDLLAVIQAPEFFQDGGAYFTGVWKQAESPPPGQTQVLKALCHGEKTIDKLARETGLSSQALATALQTLAAHDVVVATDGKTYRFTVELMRRWVQTTQINK